MKELEKTVDEIFKNSYCTITTIAKDDPLQDAFDTWVDVNGQRFGIHFNIDKSALLTAFNKELVAAEKRGASKAAEVINKEIGVEMTLDGGYYINNIRLQPRGNNG